MTFIYLGDLSLVMKQCIRKHDLKATFFSMSISTLANAIAVCFASREVKMNRLILAACLVCVVTVMTQEIMAIGETWCLLAYVSQLWLLLILLYQKFMLPSVAFAYSSAD